LSGTVARPIAVRAWSNVRIEQFKDRVREGVEHKRRLLVAGVGVHEPVDGPPGDDAIQIADRFLQARQHRQGGQPCGFLGHFERDLARHLAERTCWRAVGRKRTMAGDECSLPANPNPFERDRHTRRQLRACWKLQPRSVIRVSMLPATGTFCPVRRSIAAGLVPINRLAERSPGFVWRHPSAHDGAPVLAAGDERLIVNLSTWRTYEDLHQFVYRTALGGYVRRRLRWFVQPSGPTIVLWWVWSGHRPSTEEAFVRLEHLRARGHHRLLAVAGPPRPLE